MRRWNWWVSRSGRSPSPQRISRPATFSIPIGDGRRPSYSIQHYKYRPSQRYRCSKMVWYEAKHSFSQAVSMEKSSAGDIFRLSRNRDVFCNKFPYWSWKIYAFRAEDCDSSTTQHESGILAPTLSLVDQTTRALANTFPNAEVHREILDELLFDLENDSLPAISVMTPERCLAMLSFNLTYFQV